MTLASDLDMQRARAQFDLLQLAAMCEFVRLVVRDLDGVNYRAWAMVLTSLN